MKKELQNYTRQQFANDVVYRGRVWRHTQFTV